ncbi:ribosomal subunit 39S-domain-containing protein [Rostrohypoxylon terebratum]|nr:ribosomal subunit 39S-domain-containing protein [Rostrohypoxylon terebratum]
MRRITRLRRPSGLSANITRSQITPLVGQSPSIPSSHTIAASPRRPVPASSLPSPAFARLYSTDKKPEPEPASEPQEGSPENPQQESASPATNDASASEPQAATTTDLAPYTAEQDPTATTTTTSNFFDPEEEASRWTTFVPPPRRRRVAERTDEVTDPEYKPALTSEGLQVVGDTRRWWDDGKHWPDSANFVGFRPRVARRENGVLEVAVRRAVVEAYALRSAGQEGRLVAKWPLGGAEQMTQALGVEVKVAPDGGVKLEGDVGAVLTALGEEAEAGSAERAELEADKVEELREAWGNEWKSVSLADPRIKFAVTKRIFQLTGHLVQDFQLAGINNVQTLLHVVLKPPKPKTLTMEIQERRQDLLQLPNVHVSTKRITRGDKEKAVGRFKLIEEEFRKRDLPLKGHGNASPNTEIMRIRGDV